MRKQQMAKKFKKQGSSTSFSLRRWFEKISSTKPSSLIISIIVIGYAVFLFGGGLFTVISSPLPSYYIEGSGFMFIYPELSQQFVADTIISVMLYAIGFVGLLTIYQSTKYAYNPRQAYMMLVIGVTLLLLAYIFLEDAILIKIGS
jgi:hypothetical protein